MAGTTVLALGRDLGWLRSVAAIANGHTSVCAVHCPGGLECVMDALPRPVPGALALVDATAEYDVAGVVRRLRDLGWRSAAVVAAIPSWREAYAILCEAPWYGYWQKSYNPEVIQRDAEALLRWGERGAQELAS